MTYQVLARKWRPKSFDTLVGQEHVVRALSHALTTQRLHHAYLFTGTRGVGKTTLARIMARALNCETGITPTPCGQCSTCLEIDAGRYVDLIEVDAATNTRVDEMRQLLENAAYAPTRGRFKVYVIDEVHMLSTSAFNAMLKTLEEPPEHIKFILATTDPQKIPVTVLSRCLQFNLKQMPQHHITEHLSRILENEQVPFEPPALRHLARSAHGSMRDALSLLDQAIAHGAGRVEEEGVRAMLGTVGEDHLYAILDALMQQDIHAMLAAAAQMNERSVSFEGALQELAALVHRIALIQFAPDALPDPIEAARLKVYAESFDAEFLQLAYQILIAGREDLPRAPDEAAGFTMTLIRLHAFHPDQGGGAPRAQAPSVRKIEATPPRPAASGPAVVAPPSVAQRDAAPSVSAPVPPANKAALPAAPAELAEAMPAMAATPPQPLDESAPQDWHSILSALKVGAMARALAEHCELADLSETVVNLRIASSHKHLLMNRAPQDKLQEALQAHFGRPVKLAIMVADAVGDTPAVRAQSERVERHQRAVAALGEDGFVQQVVDLFDATLVESSIKPL
ncbi:MAG: hypothetical protein RIR70_10 [Pseudomonadota bacterium]|jgi:DNA polymerase-3 subunit gamma/tau